MVSRRSCGSRIRKAARQITNSSCSCKEAHPQITQIGLKICVICGLVFHKNLIHEDPRLGTKVHGAHSYVARFGWRYRFNEVSDDNAFLFVRDFVRDLETRTKGVAID